MLNFIVWLPTFSQSRKRKSFRVPPLPTTVAASARLNDSKADYLMPQMVEETTQASAWMLANAKHLFELGRWIYLVSVTPPSPLRKPTLRPSALSPANGFSALSV